jgi:hypothetical protein
MALAHCILGKFLGVGCHCFPPPLVVPTFSVRCLHVQRRERPLAAEGGTFRGQKMLRQISSRIRLPRNSKDLLHAAKSATWDRWLYFPFEGRRAEEFFALKNPTASAGFEPANLGTKGQQATSRPSKPIIQYTDKIIFIVRLWFFNSPFLYFQTVTADVGMLAYSNTVSLVWQHQLWIGRPSALHGRGCFS